MAQVVKQLCQLGSNLLDQAETVIGAGEFLATNSEGKKLVASGGAKAEQALATIRAVVEPGIAQAKRVLGAVDAFLKAPPCKLASRKQKYAAGVALARKLTEGGLAQSSAFKAICQIGDLAVSIMRKVAEVIKSIASNPFIRAGASAIAGLLGGPAGVAGVAAVVAIVGEVDGTLRFIQTIVRAVCFGLKPPA